MAWCTALFPFLLLLHARQYASQLHDVKGHHNATFTHGRTPHQQRGVPEEWGQREKGRKCSFRTVSETHSATKEGQNCKGWRAGWVSSLIHYYIRVVQLLDWSVLEGLSWMHWMIGYILLCMEKLHRLIPTDCNCSLGQSNWNSPYCVKRQSANQLCH